MSDFKDCFKDCFYILVTLIGLISFILSMFFQQMLAGLFLLFFFIIGLSFLTYLGNEIFIHIKQIKYHNYSLAVKEKEKRIDCRCVNT